MNQLRRFLSYALAVAATTALPAARAQQSLFQNFRAHNSQMTALQPTWIAPLIQSDSRIAQGIRFSYSNSYWPGAQTMNYGNNRGITFLAARRFQFDINPPSFFRNHSATLKDGWGNAATQVKVRLASGNAQHGNYALTAMLMRAFSPGAQQNAALTGAYIPKLGFGKAWGRFDLQNVVSGVLPTGKISVQGRVIEWNATAQVHPTAHLWLDIEDNAAWFKGGVLAGQMQNFITPAGFYTIRRKEWAPTHATYTVGGGMQIASSHYHMYNHNLIVETRILF